MIYSSWNQAQGAYDYWQTPGGGEPKINVEKPTHIASRALGSTVEQAAWPMPTNAVYVGSGEDAVGRITAPAGTDALSDDTSSSSALTGVLQIAVGVGAVLLVLHLFGKKSRR